MLFLSHADSWTWGGRGWGGVVGMEGRVCVRVSREGGGGGGAFGRPGSNS